MLAELTRLAVIRGRKGGSRVLTISLIAVTSPWTPSRLGDLTGKRIVVTGATNGVGLGTTRALAKAGAHVVLAVRNTELGKQRAAEVGGSTEVVKLDLADLASVRAFPDLIEGDIDILINNAALSPTAAPTRSTGSR
jgi:NAD(P)-dependent dehydrogenase (short-subunit alcohol dehydrogenase family)